MNDDISLRTRAPEFPCECATHISGDTSSTRITAELPSLRGSCGESYPADKQQAQIERAAFAFRVAAVRFGVTHDPARC